MEHTALQLFLIVGSPWPLWVGGVGGWVGKCDLEIGTLKFKINGGDVYFS